MLCRWIITSPLLIVLALVSGGLQAAAQTEADAEFGDRAGGGTSIVGVHRAWLPTSNYRPNTGLFLENAGSTKSSSFAPGLIILATGVGERGVVAALGGARWYALGNERFGLFASAHAGVTIGSRTGIAGFSILNDPTLTIGVATLGRIGGVVPITRDISLTLAAVHTLFTNEAGAMPVGVQVGLTLGGDE